MDEALVRSKMQQVVDLIAKDIGSIRTGRAAPSLVENLVVSVYGGTQKLKVVELATITSSDPQTLVISPWDKSIIGEIRQGILTANIGLNPSIDGDVLRIVLQPLTTEDRERYIKILWTKIENGRIMIRQIRGDSMRIIKKGFEEKSISEDEKFRLEKLIQETTDEFVKNLETIANHKEKELGGLE